MPEDAPAPSQPAQNARVLIITAAITSITTIAVSFMGIVPQLRSQDQKALDELREQVKGLQETQETKLKPAPKDAPTEKRVSISGTVKNDDGSKPLGGYDVYLLPETNNMFTAKTDDTGRFTLQGVPDFTYSIIVRDSTNGRSGKGLLDDTGDEVQVIGARIKYRIQK
jgi:hypothetical protein